MKQTADPGFDPRIADWLENDPDTAPSLVLATVVGALPSIPQRQHWRDFWRSRTMPRYAFGATVVGLVVIAALAIVTRPALEPGTPTAPPSPTISPTTTAAVTATPAASTSSLPTFGESHTSGINRLTFRYPSGWELTPATMLASGLSGPLELYDRVSTSRSRFIALSVPLADQSQAEWMQAAEAQMDGCGTTSGQLDLALANQVAARLTAESCSSLGPFPRNRWWRAIAASAERGYVFQFDSNDSDQLEWFKEFLSHVTLGVPELDATFTSAVNNLAFRYPSGWRLTPAVGPGGTEAARVPDEVATSGASFSAESWRPSGKTAQAWLADYEVPDHCALTPELEASVLIGGQIGTLLGHCLASLVPSRWTAAVAVGDRVYWFEFRAKRYGFSERETFEIFLANVSLGTP